MARHFHQHTVYSSTTTHEHRAPTDESVRLLREMEAEARSTVIRAGSVDVGGQVVAAVHSDPTHHGHVVYIKINGEEFTVPLRDYRMSMSPADLLRTAANEIASHLVRRMDWRPS